MKKRSAITFCEECRTESNYKIEYRKEIINIKEKSYEMILPMAICQNCGAEVDDGEIFDIRIDEIDRQYREIEGIVSIDDIKNLMRIYNIGKAPLSYALGFGEITISRYLQGQIPSKEYSNIIKNALESPDYMIRLLNDNRDKIGGTAYEKSMKAALELKTLFKVSDKMLSTISYLFEKMEEITPLALQKILYFVQSIYIFRYERPLFEENCIAWVHGPVYEPVYNLFKSFRYNPIDDDRFSILKNRFNELDNEEKNVIDDVIETFGRYSGKVLEQITHLETPWLKARKGYDINELSAEEIPIGDIKEYFTSISYKFDLRSKKGLLEYIDAQLKK